MMFIADHMNSLDWLSIWAAFFASFISFVISLITINSQRKRMYRYELRLSLYKSAAFIGDSAEKDLSRDVLLILEGKYHSNLDAKRRAEIIADYMVDSQFKKKFFYQISQEVTRNNLSLDIEKFGQVSEIFRKDYSVDEDVRRVVFDSLNSAEIRDAPASQIPKNRIVKYFSSRNRFFSDKTDDFKRDVVEALGFALFESESASVEQKSMGAS